jgi:hypothetical protein
MNRVYVLLAILLNVAGCSRDVVNPVTSDTFIKYKFNGAVVQFTGDINNLAATGIGVAAIKQAASPTQGIPKTRYIIQGQNGLNNIISLVIITDSLMPSQSYNSSDSASWGPTFVKQDGNTYTTNVRPADKFQITISRYSEGSIDGSFSGIGAQVKTVNGVPNYTDGVVSEGTFQKVKIAY